MLERLVNFFGANCLHINSDQRRQLHLAAVLVNNFPNYLYAQAEVLCIEKGLSFELLKPLLFETVSKSTALACQNFMLALVAEGFDSCPMEGFDERVDLPATERIQELTEEGLSPEEIIMRGFSFEKVNEALKNGS